MKIPNIQTQLMSQKGMGRPGGMMSQGSKPNVNQGVGSGFAAMENALLKGGAKSPKKVAKGGKGRQFLKQAAE